MRPGPASALSRAEARDVYDAFGARQDGQGWYEDAAFDALIRHGDFAAAQTVVEVGCGTGRLAQRLLADVLPPEAGYIGIDLSGTMVDLARARLSPWADRASARLSDGGFDLPKSDRVVSTYLLDLLSEADIEAFFHAAAMALPPHGRLCLANLAVAGFLNRLWSVAYRLRPRRFGGCRPVTLVDRLERHGLHLLHRERVQGRGLWSEVLIAGPIRRG